MIQRKSTEKLPSKPAEQPIGVNIRIGLDAIRSHIGLENETSNNPSAGDPTMRLKGQAEVLPEIFGKGI